MTDVKGFNLFAQVNDRILKVPCPATSLFNATRDAIDLMEGWQATVEGFTISPDPHWQPKRDELKAGIIPKP